MVCDGADNTSDQVNTAIGAATPPSVSITVNPGATVVRGGASAIRPLNAPFNGAIAFTNSGTVGTTAANVDFIYVGSPMETANTLTLDNSGVLNGQLFAFNLGGAITASNSGTITNGIDLEGSGAITLTSSGPVQAGSAFYGVYLRSYRTNFMTPDADADGVVHQIDMGDVATATISGAVANPGSGGTPAPLPIRIVGVGGANLTLSALAGSISVGTFGTASDYTPVGMDKVVTSGGTTTRTTITNNRSLGGNASATIDAAGQASNLFVFSGTGSAAASVAGSVGSDTSTGNVSVQSFGSDDRFQRVVTITTIPTLTTTSTTTTSSSTPLGGTATADLAATAIVVGSVNASSNHGDATVTIAGQTGSPAYSGSVAASTIGTNSTSTSTFTSTSPSDGTSANSSASTAEAAGGDAAVTVASTGNVYGSVSANGDSGASVTNGGRIRGSLTATSNRGLTTASASNNSRTITPGTDGASTQVIASGSSSTGTQVGGTATATNQAGGVVEGSLNVSGIAGASLTNAGAVFGDVSLTSQGGISTNASTNMTTRVTTPDPAGGTMTSVTGATTSDGSFRPTGGAVTGNYSGTVGAVGSSTLAGFRTVQQSGTTASNATIGGTLYADFDGFAGATGNTFSSATNSTSVTQAAVGPATGANARSTSSTSRQSYTTAPSTSSATVTGRIANNGFGTGNLFLESDGGNATLTLSGGVIDGSADIEAGTGFTANFGSDSAASFTTAATMTGPAAPEVQQTFTSSSFDEYHTPSGTATATIESGRIGGNLSSFGAGAGAGTLGSSVTVGTGASIGGSVSAGVFSDEFRDDYGTTIARTGATAVTRTDTYHSVSTNVAGGVSVDIAGGTAATLGVTGSVDASAPVGNATVNISGSVGGGVTVRSAGTDYDDADTQSYAGTGFAASFTRQTAGSSSFTSTATGGTAALNIATNAALQGINATAVGGSVNVAGLAGSTLTTTAGSRLLSGNSGSISVGQTFFNTTGSTVRTFATAPLPTGSTTTSTSTAVGGPASVTNAGIIGAPSGFFSAPVPIFVQSVGGASLTNSGTIYGSVFANAIGSNQTYSQVLTNALDAVTRQTVTTNVFTPVGGTAAVTNTSLITGSVGVAGATGTVANSGVIRGGINLGQAVASYTSVNTATATSNVTAPSVLPATLFAQTYTVDQNGLLIGGITVTGATTFDPVTVPDGTTAPPLRTSTVTAAINLNNGSVTLGNITAQTAPLTAAANPGARLTNTSLNLNGAGFLGTPGGPLDQPNLAVAATTTPGLSTPLVSLLTNGAQLAFTPASSVARFAAIDPLLGTTNTAGVFTPSGNLPIGIRVTGVETVAKTGAGAFVIVGAPLLRNTAAPTPVPTYTFDIGTFRINAGEVQLGVSGPDPANGQSVFGIKGNVENNATLVLGRRVTDGTSQVIQGTNLLVTGNYANNAGGTLVVAATPSLIRQAGAPLTVTPATDVFGFGQFGVALTPFVPFGLQAGTLTSTPGLLTVDGNLSFAGNLSVAATPGAIYQAGRNFDVFNVGGTFTNTATLASSFSSPFVKFTLTPRTVGGRTIVSVDVSRTAYASVVPNDANAAAAAAALEAAIPGVVSTITTANMTGSFGSAQTYGLVQDLATVIAGLDTQLTAAQAAEAFRELSSGEFYGSLSALTTTAPFGEATDGLLASETTRVGLWFRPTGRFATFKADPAAGASKIHADSYGGSIGLNIASGGGGNFGVAGGFGHLKVESRGTPEQANADTYMVGAYGSQELAMGSGILRFSGQAVFGWTQWDATRELPLFSRTASASFHSKEFRASLRVGYDWAFGGFTATPFGRIEVRHYKFDGFAEEDAGGIGLAVARRSKSVLSPEVGLRLGSEFGVIRPFAEGSYTFLGKVGSDRDLSYLGSPTTSFRVKGVDPDGFARIGAGLSAGIGAASLFVRGDYSFTGDQKVAEAKAGVLIQF